MHQSSGIPLAPAALAQVTQAAPVTLSLAVASFLAAQTAEKSPQTRLWYAARLNLLAQSLGGDRPLESVLECDLIAWSVTVNQSNLAPDTKHGYIRAARRFCHWLYQRDLVPMDLARDLRLPHLPPRARKGISDENARAILEAARDHPRDYSLLLFLESTNARRGGIADLRLGDLDLNAPPPLNRRATVREKTGERVVIMSPTCLATLLKWLPLRRSITDHIWHNETTGAPLLPSGISEILKRYKERLGLSGPCSPHQWRHRWCRARLQAGMPLAQVSQLAGHKSVLVTSSFYGVFALDELAQAYDRYYAPP
ncbi:MAG: tyrosine-type recombinase/integrase [Chloroflexota bacterium]